MDPTWNVEINLFDGDLAQKIQILCKIYQSQHIFNETDAAEMDFLYIIDPGF